MCTCCRFLAILALTFTTSKCFLALFFSETRVLKPMLVLLASTAAGSADQLMHAAAQLSSSNTAIEHAFIISAGNVDEILLRTVSISSARLGSGFCCCCCCSVNRSWPAAGLTVDDLLRGIVLLLPTRAATLELRWRGARGYPGKEPQHTTNCICQTPAQYPCHITNASSNARFKMSAMGHVLLPVC